MTYLLAALFFTLAFLGAAVALHMTVRTYWREILLALRGEWGTSPKARPAAQPAPAFAAQRHAAF